MRQIGTIENTLQAEVFEDYLLTLGIQSTVESDDDGWAVWVHDEDRVDEARQEIAVFAQNPNDPRFQKVREEARQLREKALQEQEAAHKRVVDVRRQWSRPIYVRCPVTFGLILISIFVAVSSRLGEQYEPLLAELSITDYRANGFQLRGIGGLPEIRNGDVWRLVTPIFIHFGILHILFNSLMTYQLGTAVEITRGRWKMAAFVLLMAIPSNLGQYLMVGPAFGGLSGVVYGLFGYIWMKSRFDPSIGLYMPQNLVFWLMAWFFLGVFNVIPGIANTAHGVGLGMGILLGYVPAMWKRIRRT